MRNTVADEHQHALHFASVWSNLSLGKHVTYASSTERDSSFIELTDMHFVLGEWNGKATGAVRRYRENYPSRRIPNRRTFLSVDRRLRETVTFRGMWQDVGQHIQCVMYGLKSRSWRSLKGILPSISYVMHLVRVPFMLLYTVHYKNGSCIYPYLIETARVPHDAPARRAFSQ